MKKNLGKFIVSCAAIMSVSAAMAISASAAVSYDAATTTVSNSETMAVASGKQATILVAAETDSALTEGDIYYIDQQTSTGALPAAWQSIKVKALSDGNYVLKMGGEGVTPNSVTFAVGGGETPDNPPIGGDGTEYLKGDVNKDGKLNTRDSLRILQHYAQVEGKIIPATAEGKVGLFELADVNSDGKINTRDSLRVLQHYAKVEGKEVTEKITVTDE